MVVSADFALLDPASAAALREAPGQCVDAGRWTQQAADAWWAGYRAGSR